MRPRRAGELRKVGEVVSEERAAVEVGSSAGFIHGSLEGSGARLAAVESALLVSVV